MEADQNSPKPAKRIVLETSANLKINTGNYETIDVSKTLKVEIEYTNAEELAKKSKSVDILIARLVKAEGETLLKETGRTRKPSVIEEIASTEIFNGPPATPALVEER